MHAVYIVLQARLSARESLARKTINLCTLAMLYFMDFSWMQASSSNAVVLVKGFMLYLTFLALINCEPLWLSLLIVSSFYNCFS